MFSIGALLVWFGYAALYSGASQLPFANSLVDGKYTFFEALLGKGTTTSTPGTNQPSADTGNYQGNLTGQPAGPAITPISGTVQA